jgi:hypothetical protein
VRIDSSKLRGLIVAAVAALALAAGAPPAAADENGEAVAAHSRALIFGSPGEFLSALASLTARGKPDVVPAMILALRYRNGAAGELSRALEALTGHSALGWFDWMIWQERHPEITPHDSFAEVKLEIFRRIDPAFLRFFPDQATLAGLRIRLEEITWGGVAVDGIPSLDTPKLIAAAEAGYLLDDDLVFGVEIKGDARAYPLRIMGWHEMFNEVIGGVPVALAYCTLCGSGILFETRVEGRERPFVFGSSGLLYRSNKLMFDRETDSLWNQFTGRPVSGPLVDSGIELEIRPVAITSWARWRERHPESRVLSLETGHLRNYGSGVVYHEYFSSPDLMFPTGVDETLLRQKDYVFGIRDVAASKAWPIEAFAGGAVINDTVGRREVVLVGDAATRTVRAYERRGRRFEATEDPARLKSGDGDWQVGEDALTGPDGAKLPRVPGHIAYWFAWNGYLGAESELYRAAE